MEEIKIVSMNKEELGSIIEEKVRLVIKEKSDSNSDPVNNDVRKLLSRKDVAEIFDVTLVTISHWCKKGILNPIRMETRVYFLVDDINNLLLND
ncbi:MAG: helix-turn-helix domain-containing protein [Flavobacteriales bacterium]|nr:helix-turn-helix domain-containing protein [Flavobacteriales bacterium]